MISAILLIDAKGKNIVSRYYRYFVVWVDYYCSGDVTRESADAFRTNVIAKKDTGSKPPITYIDGTTFIYVRNADHYIVAVTKKNASPGRWCIFSVTIRFDLPLLVPPREDVQELLRCWIQGCLWFVCVVMYRMICVSASLSCTKSSMVGLSLVCDV